MWCELRFLFFLQRKPTIPACFYSSYFQYRFAVSPLSYITFPYICGLCFGTLFSLIGQFGDSCASTTFFNFCNYLSLDIWNIKPSQLCSSSRMSWLYLFSFSLINFRIIFSGSLENFVGWICIKCVDQFGENWHLMKVSFRLWIWNISPHLFRSWMCFQ